MSRPDELSEIKAALAGRAESFLMWLFPNGRRQGSEFTVGDLDGGSGKSLSVCLSGPKAGVGQDFATGEGFDNLLELLRAVRGGSFADAVREAREWLGLGPAEFARPHQRALASSVAASPAIKPRLTLPADAHRPDDEECAAIARSRRLNPEAVTLASCWGLLLVGTVCRQPSWILTDASGHVAEARRMDGQTFPAFGDLGERKAHTLKGSVKNWPCGLAPKDGIPEGIRAILLVEGGPDLLAALHFCLGQERWDLWPVAMLGAGAGTFHPDALPLLAGRRVRLYPHADDTGGEASRRWATQLQGLGCKVDGFSFAGIPRRDGRPSKDLNDSALVAPDVAATYLEEVLPL